MFIHARRRVGRRSLRSAHCARSRAALRRGALVLAVGLSAAVGGISLASAGETVVVSADQTATQNCDRLRTTLAGLANPGPGNRYLIKLGPGPFACKQPLDMREYVDVEGSGRGVTRVYANITGDETARPAVVRLASHMELRQLTVLNEVKQARPYAFAVLADGVDGARISEVTVRVLAHTAGSMPEARGEAIRVMGGGILEIDTATATAEGAAPATCAIATRGVFEPSATLRLLNVRAAAATGGDGIGLCAEASAATYMAVHIRDSVLAGRVASVHATGGYVWIAHSELDGPVAATPDRAAFQVAGRIVGPPLANTLHEPVVARLDDGGFVIAWLAAPLSRTGGLWTVDLLARRYDAAGNAAGAAFLVQEAVELGSLSPATMGDHAAAITGLTGGGFVVAWHHIGEETTSGTAHHIYGKRYDAQAGIGVVAGGTVAAAQGFSPFPYLGQVKPFADGHVQYHPDLATLADGGFVIAWEAGVFGNSATLVRGLRYAADGTVVGTGTPFTVAAATDVFQPDANAPPDQLRTGSHRSPSIATWADGGFTIAWATGGYDPVPDPADIGVFARRYPPGAEEGSVFRVETCRAEDQVRPSATGLTGGGFVVAWDSACAWRGTAPEAPSPHPWFDIAARRFDYDSGEFAANASTADDALPDTDQKYAAAAGLAGGGFVVTWLNLQAADIEGQLFAADTWPLGSYLEIDAAGNPVGRPSVVGLQGGGGVVTWMQNNDVWAQLFATAGSVKCVFAYDANYDPLDPNCQRP